MRIITRARRDRTLSAGAYDSLYKQACYLLKWDNVTFSRGALSRLFFASNCIALDVCSYLSEIGDAFRGLIARFYSTHKAIHDFNFPRICFLVQLVD